MNDGRKRKRHLADQLEPNDSIRITLEVEGTVRSKKQHDDGTWLIAMKPIKSCVHSTETVTSDNGKQSVPRARPANWSTNGAESAIVFQVGANQRIEYLGVPKVVRQQIEALSLEDLRDLVAAAEKKLETNQQAVPRKPEVSP